MTPLSSLPWKTHAISFVVCPVVLVLPPFVVHGVGTETRTGADLLMSAGFYVVAGLVTVPLLWIEVTAASSPRPDANAAQSSAVVAHFMLALMGTLPVTLHHVLALSQPDPVGMHLVRSAAASYALLLAGYFAALLAVVRIQSRGG